MVNKNGLQVFENENFGNVRVVMRDGEPWFVAADVCRILEIGNPSQALVRLDDDEHFTTLISNDGAASGQSYMAFVNEPGMYALVLGSRKAEAKAFKRWITHDVIPSIRKHGMYATDELILNPDLAIAAFKALKEERTKRKALEEENAQQRQIIAESEPKVTYYDRVLSCRNAISISKIAKDYGETPQWLNNYLHDKGVQYKQGDMWLLYNKFARMGYTKSKTFQLSGTPKVKLQTCWTQKGRLFIYDLLKSDGILPLIEKDEDTLC